MIASRRRAGPGRSALAFAAMLLATLAWVAALVVSPLLLANPGGCGAGHAAAALVYRAGALVCHQRPGRCFSVGGVPLPVCARCTGLYFSAPLGVAGAWAASRRASRRRGRRDGNGWRTARAASAVPTGLTVALEWSHAAAVSNAARSAAAWPLGVVVAWMVAATLAALAEGGGRRRAGYGRAGSTM